MTDTTNLLKESEGYVVKRRQFATIFLGLTLAISVSAFTKVTSEPQALDLVELWHPNVLGSTEREGASATFRLVSTDTSHPGFNLLIECSHTPLDMMWHIAICSETEEPSIATGQGCTNFRLSSKYFGANPRVIVHRQHQGQYELLTVQNEAGVLDGEDFPGVWLWESQGGKFTPTKLLREPTYSPPRGLGLLDKNMPGVLESKNTAFRPWPL